jgi:hypothetical protein
MVLLAMFALGQVGGCATPGSPPLRNGSAAQVLSLQPARPASNKELDRYAQREKEAGKLEKFQGGEGGYIATSTVIIILLVVIVVLLIV